MNEDTIDTNQQLDFLSRTIMPTQERVQQPLAFFPPPSQPGSPHSLRPRRLSCKPTPCRYSQWSRYPKGNTRDPRRGNAIVYRQEVGVGGQRLRKQKVRRGLCAQPKAPQSSLDNSSAYSIARTYSSRTASTGSPI